MIDWYWIWITLIVLALCAIIPIRIYAADDRNRKIVNWLILIPLSLIIIFYIYPVGIRFFQNLATSV